MKLTQDVRELAQAEARQGLAEKAREFRESGGELYVPADSKTGDAAE
jgi:hypothetical protein